MSESSVLSAVSRVKRDKLTQIADAKSKMEKDWAECVAEVKKRLTEDLPEDLETIRVASDKEINAQLAFRSATQGQKAFPP